MTQPLIHTCAYNLELKLIASPRGDEVPPALEVKQRCKLCGATGATGLFLAAAPESALRWSEGFGKENPEG